MSTQTSQGPLPVRHDPIGDRYYAPLAVSDHVERALFYLASAASFAPLAIDGASHPRLHEFVQAVFVAIVCLNFCAATGNRLYFFPRAQDARRRGLISDAFGVNLTQPLPTGYYNNTLPPSPLRLGACTLESLFFTKSILGKMAPWERFRAVSYLSLWLMIATLRDTDIDLLTAGAQLLLSEQLLFRWLRLEWTRNRMEILYDSAYQLMTTTAVRKDGDDHTMPAYTASIFADYEAAKTLGGIALSKQMLIRHNNELNTAWLEVERSLHTSS